jgi:hypothetical protein
MASMVDVQGSSFQTLIYYLSALQLLTYSYRILNTHQNVDAENSLRIIVWSLVYTFFEIQLRANCFSLLLSGWVPLDYDSFLNSDSFP